MPNAGDKVLATDNGYWQSWTPTLTNLTLGSGGSVVARYSQSGKTVDLTFAFTFGTGSAVGTNPTFTLPVTAASGISWRPLGNISFVDNGGSTYTGALVISNTTTASIQVYTASGTYAAYTTPVSSTVPFTWAAADAFFAQGTYEAA